MRSGNGVRVGTGRGPRGDRAGPVLNEADRGPPGRISLAEKHALDTSTLTADVVVAKLTQAYMAGLKRCYRNYLRKDATARGTLVLELTVNATGRTTDPAAHGVSDEVAGCAGAQMEPWRFPAPKDDAGAPTTARFRIVLTLVPD